ncbi:hypothetical protein EUGRSUZ_D01429 [Eucalyptus grandis]|uniref:Uncharacterized protein n=2 Tax=Eucalyptus grandis TaxID=71139 RepID=A0ACC3L449_EUCGR|nr:hypothetical protein EUGRSUZ_D01429 [Eucalyptus grandis]
MRNVCTREKSRSQRGDITNSPSLIKKASGIMRFDKVQSHPPGPAHPPKSKHEENDPRRDISSLFTNTQNPQRQKHCVPPPKPTNNNTWSPKNKI